MSNSHLRVLATPMGGGQSCGQYADAPVCQNGNQDVHCTGELYRGCQPGATDCADTPENPDDGCCAGWGPGVGDNIDHATCRTEDATFGGTCLSGIWDSRENQCAFWWA